MRRKPHLSDKLTEKQARFVETYDGNAEKAAIAAGYTEKFAKAKSHELLKHPVVVAAIKSRPIVEASNARIATRIERQAFWTKVMLGEETETVVTKEGAIVDVPVSMKERLKASELLGRSEADFTDKLQHGADSSFADMLKAARERLASR